jgi:MFS family permease
MTAGTSIKLGLFENWRQFSLLLLINAFVGAMVGLERTIVPLIASEDFGLTSVSVTLSFIISFGVVKAFANLFAGSNADRIGRKPLLVAGWLIGIPVPFMVIFAPTWEWIVFANVLLGINQGLCWSSAVIMKIDLVGPVGRGRATGLNEFSGYVAMALTTISIGWVAAETALRPYPFYFGIVFALAGLLLSVLFVRETRGHAQQEARQHTQAQEPKPSFWTVFRRVSWQDKRFFSLSQGGLVNNLNDVVIWGLLPLLAISAGVTVEQAAGIGSLYLGVWGVGQLFTGALSDRIGRKPLITGGLWVTAVGIGLFALATDAMLWFVASAIMGWGTAMVYPTFLAAMSDLAHPNWRASALGVYRLWRDSGYAFGALLGGVLSDIFTIQIAVLIIAALTVLSGGVTAIFLPETAAKARLSAGMSRATAQSVPRSQDV